MDPVEVLRMLGGTASRADLMRRSSRAELDRALSDGTVERVSRRRYALPTLPSSVKTATALSGVLSHESAAEFWRLETVANPTTVHVTVPPRAHRPFQKGVRLHYAATEDTTDEATSPLRTVLDCARTMPFREGLAIADSAVRSNLVGKDELLEAAHRLTNRGRLRALRVITHCTAAAANPFESALRAEAIEAELLDFVPQLQIRQDGINYRVDLGDPVHLVVAEADSFEYHGSATALERDCRRYDELVSRGWLVLRFSWEQVMFDPQWVRTMLIATHGLRVNGPGGVIESHP